MNTPADIATATPPDAAAPRRGPQRQAAGQGRRTLRRSVPDWVWQGASRPPENRPCVPLRDGSRVLIRQVTSGDAARLADGFTRLSDRSRQMRFLRTKEQLTAAELRYFTDIDHHDHEALGAVSCADGRGVGIARYIRDADDPHAAEIAITIVDEWQRRGLGTELLARLSGSARLAGIRHFTALVSTDNTAITGLLHKSGATIASRGFGTIEYAIGLLPEEAAAERCG